MKYNKERNRWILVTIFGIYMFIQCTRSLHGYQMVTAEPADVIENPSTLLTEEVTTQLQSNIEGPTNETVDAPEVITPELPTVEEPVVPEESEPSPYVELTLGEKYIFATLIYLEGGIESVECQLAIGSVILNRLTTGNYRNITEVIYAQNQFTPAYKIAQTCPTQTQIDIVEQLVTNGPTIPEYVTYFRSRYYHEWGDLVAWKSMDHTYFSYDPRLYDRLTQ